MVLNVSGSSNNRTETFGGPAGLPAPGRLPPLIFHPRLEVGSS